MREAPKHPVAKSGTRFGCRITPSAGTKLGSFDCGKAHPIRAAAIWHANLLQRRFQDLARVVVVPAPEPPQRGLGKTICAGVAGPEGAEG
jgi:hypothetical protein